MDIDDARILKYDRAFVLSQSCLDHSGCLECLLVRPPYLHIVHPFHVPCPTYSLKVSMMPLHGRITTSTYSNKQTSSQDISLQRVPRPSSKAAVFAPGSPPIPAVRRCRTRSSARRWILRAANRGRRHARKRRAPCRILCTSRRQTL